MAAEHVQQLPARLPPDPVIDAYKKDVDRTLIRHFLKLTPEQRLLSLQDSLADGAALQQAMRDAKARDKGST
jgi:hypothetical protein